MQRVQKVSASFSGVTGFQGIYIRFPTYLRPVFRVACSRFSSIIRSGDLWKYSEKNLMRQNDT